MQPFTRIKAGCSATIYASIYLMLMMRTTTKNTTNSVPTWVSLCRGANVPVSYGISSDGRLRLYSVVRHFACSIVDTSKKRDLQHYSVPLDAKYGEKKPLVSSFASVCTADIMDQPSMVWFGAFLKCLRYRYSLSSRHTTKRTSGN